jgi:hypothetical protein
MDGEEPMRFDHAMNLATATLVPIWVLTFAMSKCPAESYATYPFKAGDRINQTKEFTLIADTLKNDFVPSDGGYNLGKATKFQPWIKSGTKLVQLYTYEANREEAVVYPDGGCTARIEDGGVVSDHGPLCQAFQRVYQPQVIRD